MCAGQKFTKKQIHSILSQFDSYCKAVLRNEYRNVMDAKIRRENGISTVSVSDEDIPDKGIHPFEHCELKAETGIAHIGYYEVYDSLLELPEHKRKALMLRYFDNWDDKKIASRFKVSTRTIGKWRNSSLEYIRGIVKEEPSHRKSDD